MGPLHISACCSLQQGIRQLVGEVEIVVRGNNQLVCRWGVRVKRGMKLSSLSWLLGGKALSSLWQREDSKLVVGIFVGRGDRLYSSAVLENQFERFSTPEILRSPIEGMVLQVASHPSSQSSHIPPSSQSSYFHPLSQSRAWCAAGCTHPPLNQIKGMALEMRITTVLYYAGALYGEAVRVCARVCALKLCVCVCACVR